MIPIILDPNQSDAARYAPWVEQITSATGLFVVSTPIGHLGDMTLRGLLTLANVHGILSEDTRQTRVLLEFYGIQTPCYAYHAHNEYRKLRGVVNLLQQGKRLALVSDRGTPLIADPGSLLVRACLASGIPVHVAGGVSSLTHALVASGMESGPFFFQGFLPRRKMSDMWKRLCSLTVPVIFFVPPHDMTSFLNQVIEHMGDREVTLLRELSKKHEQRLCWPVSRMVTWVQQQPVLGECVVMVGPASSEARVTSCMQETSHVSCVEPKKRPNRWAKKTKAEAEEEEGAQESRADEPELAHEHEG